MKIIIDTNIIFSLLLNPNNSLGDIFFNSRGNFEFYSCGYMKFEIKKHWKKIIAISKLSEKELQVSYDSIVSRIKFINEEIIPTEVWISSEEIAEKIDIDDVAFIALTTFLEGTLWTGDKVLYNGLKKVEFKTAVNTNELFEIKKYK